MSSRTERRSSASSRRTDGNHAHQPTGGGHGTLLGLDLPIGHWFVVVPLTQLGGVSIE
jgi:hypothetical protein